MTVKAESPAPAKPASPQPIPPTPTRAGGLSRRTTIGLIVGLIAFVAVAAAVGILDLVKTHPPKPSPTSSPSPTPSSSPAFTPAPGVSGPIAPVAPTSPLPAGTQITYSVTGTKAPDDIISVTFIDASGRSRTQHNVYLPWSMTVTSISQSDVGSVQASSMNRTSKLNCSITTSDGTVLVSNTSDAPQTSC
jgi:hypothetical protein